MKSVDGSAMERRDSVGVVGNESGEESVSVGVSKEDHGEGFSAPFLAQHVGEINLERLKELRTGEWQPPKGKKAIQLEGAQQEQQLLIGHFMKGDYSVIETNEQKEGREWNDYVLLSFIISFVLVGVKIGVLEMSRSISILALLLASILEFISGLMNYLSRRLQIIKTTKDYYNYPVGKRRLETLTIIVFSTSMFTLTGELLVRSIQKIIDPLSISLYFGYLSISLATLTVMFKFLLWIIGKRQNSTRVHELALDHLMDVFTNTIGLLCGLLGYYYWPLLDPIGGLALGLFLMTKWAFTGIQNVKLMSGKTADPQILTMLTHIAAFHHPKIKAVDSVRAYYVSNRLLVEIDIVLPEDMKLKEAHDIGESLQYKIEKVPDIERAFVHLDFEIEHRHLDEHPTLIKLHSKFNTKDLLHPNPTPATTNSSQPNKDPIPFKQTT